MRRRQGSDRLKRLSHNASARFCRGTEDGCSPVVIQTLSQVAAQVYAAETARGLENRV
jgi:hypothetical protein